MHDEELGSRSARPVLNDLAGHVEAAILPLRAHLNLEQLEIVRSVLCSSIETDPVSRLLVQSAIAVCAGSVTVPRAPSALRRSAGGAPVARSRDMKNKL
jgi:hypothetical protein